MVRNFYSALSINAQCSPFMFEIYKIEPNPAQVANNPSQASAFLMLIIKFNGSSPNYKIGSINNI